MPTRIERNIQRARPTPTRGEMRRFRLNVGVHIEPDWAAIQPEDWNEDVQGLWKRPSLEYKQGEVVLSPTDLVAKFGREKFSEVGENRRPIVRGEVAEQNLTQFPGGQVASGFQGTVGVPEGTETPTGLPQVSGQATKQGAKLPIPTDTGKPSSTPTVRTAKEIESEYSDGKGYDSMTVDELKSVASDEEIDITGATVKADIIKRLRK